MRFYFTSAMLQPFNLNQIDTIAKDFISQINIPCVIALHGEMGAGKTTFIKAICKTLQVTDIISSPTYAIINQYTTIHGDPIYHMDLYRLKDEQEAIAAGVEDTLYSNHTCLVEWPEKAATLLPDHTVHITIERIDNETRRISLHKKP